ncbi:MAG: SDR family oxidoreductase [Deltaproteobacteria bacterium]|nr:SDR family oxidoreductase [Deltaproteobacteria bacterium]
MNPAHDPFSVAGKAVIVTGGGTGIGAAIARVFSERGAKVLIASRNGEHLGPVAKALRDDGGIVESVTCDVRDPDQVEAMVDRAEQAFGGVDVMISNHGASFYARAEELSPNGFATIVAINLNGAFLCARAVARRWIERKQGGRIITMSSEAGIYGAPGMSHYAAAKAGVQQLTRTLAMEWAQYGILVNCIAPGPIDTPEAATRSWGTPEMKKQVEASTALNRLGRVEEIAWPCVFLASEAAGFVTGQTFSVDGGPTSPLTIP